MKNIVILGGGLSGLAAAETLVGEYNVIVLEKESMLGGLASSYYYKETWIPIVYHHIMKVDKFTLEYIKKYNLSKYLYWNSINMVFWYGNKSYPLTKPEHILTFRPLSIKSRLNLIKLGLYVRCKKKNNNLEGVPADVWLNKFVNKEVTEKIFKRLAEIKFGALSSVDAAWFVSRLHEAAKTRDKYAYLSCGYQELIDSMANYIKEKGGVIKTNAQIKEIKKDKVIVMIDGKQETFKADKIISSVPPKTLAKISDLSSEVKEELNKIDYKAIICMLFTTKEKVMKDYWNIIIEPELSFGGIFNHTALYPKQIVEGENLFYVFKYIDYNDSFYKLDENAIQNKFFEDLRKLFPDVDPIWAKVFKIKESSPVFVKAYKNLPIKISDNVYLTGVYKEYPCTRTMHTALESGVKTANYILKELD